MKVLAWFAAPRALALMGLLLVLVGCGDDGGDGGGLDAPSLRPDSGPAVPDAGQVVPDAAPVDPDAAPAVPDAAAADAAATDAGDGCTEVTLRDRDLHFNAFNQLTGVSFSLGQNVDGPLPESLLIELFDSTTGDGLPPLAPGTFPLGEGINANLATCQHCVWIPLDWDGAAPLERAFFATQGAVTLQDVSDPFEPQFRGSISAIVLREVAVDESGHSTPVDGGRCLRVASQAFDTRVTPGQQCLSAKDCGNSLLEVCSPATNSCTEPECNDFFAVCPSERPVCIPQDERAGGLLGACYADCNPTTNVGCASGRVCLQRGVDPTFGVCKGIGTGAVGSACVVDDNSSSCGEGLLCSEDGFCTRSCRYFDAAPGCQPGTQCNLFGVCETPARAIDVAVGAACGTSASFTQGCAPDGSAFRGFCFATSETEPLICEKSCLGPLGCGAGEFCARRFESGLGICTPDPVCGDGDRGEIDELCDDGNTTSNDGCSADCRTVEYDILCGAAPALAPNSSVDGDTGQRADGFQASCQLGIARANVYAFDPPGRGRLRLTVDSPTQHVMSVRTACADAASEVACAENSPFGFANELVTMVTDDRVALTLMVSAFTILEQGPYTLNVEWTDEVCGDGVIAGREVCDDGNTISNDGCRADCREIEYATYCAQATELVAGSTIEGDTSGGSSVFAATCSNPFNGSGSERLYRYTATAAGRLQLELTTTACLLSMAVLDECDAPGTFPELACANSFASPSLEVPVSEGDTLTILVEGFEPSEACAFTLSSELLPP